jgi:hypothetical protein
MAGKVVVSTLNNDTGVLATQNGMTGIAKAWVNFNGTGTVAIRDSFNVSSITDNGTGDYTVNFTTAMPNANYVSVFGIRNIDPAFLNNLEIKYNTTPTVSAINVIATSTNASQTFIGRDSDWLNVAVFSS